MPGSFKLRKSKSAKTRPVVVDQREVENMRRFLNAKKDSVTKSKAHENVHKSMPASIDKTEELVEYPGGKYKRPILRKSAKPVDQTRRSADNIKHLTSDKAEQSSQRKGNERPKSMPPGSTKSSNLKPDGPRERKEDNREKTSAKPSPLKEDEVLEWPPDHWNRSPGRVKPDEFIARPISLDMSEEDQKLVQSKRLESTTSTPQQQRSPIRYHHHHQQQQQQQHPPPAPPPPPLPQPKQENASGQQQTRDIRRPKQTPHDERTVRPRSDMDVRVMPRTTPHLGPTDKRYTQLPEEMLMSRSFDLGEIEHHRRRTLSLGEQKKKRGYDTPDSGKRNERLRIPTKYDQERYNQRQNILGTKTTSTPVNRHAKSVMELKDWELYWDQYQRKQYAQYKNGKTFNFYIPSL